MENIDTILEAFLEEQNNRLKQKTYRDYKSVIQLFQAYLNEYAPNYLDEHEWKKWKAHYHEDEDCYTKLFGPEKLSSSDFREFLDYFMIRKVMSSESLMKSAVRVMKKLNKWLFENHYFDQITYNELKEYFGEANDLPKVEKLSDLIFDYARMSPDKPYEEILQDYFNVADIAKGQLWLDQAFGDRTNIGPVHVSTQISDLCQKGWELNLVIGLYKGTWYVLESGFAYRN